MWQQDLDPSKIPDKKAIRTLTYGVRSSGNQQRPVYVRQQTYPKMNTQRSVE